jgi:hypothetical protein
MKRLTASILLFVLACLLTVDAAKFPDIHTDFTNACSANAESTRFTAAQTKLLVQCPEGAIKIKCNVNTELCSLMDSAKPTLAHLKLIKTSFLEDYVLLSAMVDGREVSYLSSAEPAVARAYQAIWVYVALLWLAFLASLFLLKKNTIGRWL